MIVSEAIRIEVHAGDGGDNVKADGNFPIPLWPHSESGDDRLSSGKASDILFGGPGNDFFQGKQRKGLLVEGTGSDQLNGGTDDDILIAS